MGKKCHYEILWKMKKKKGMVWRCGVRPLNALLCDVFVIIRDDKYKGEQNENKSFNKNVNNKPAQK